MGTNFLGLTHHYQNYCTKASVKYKAVPESCHDLIDWNFYLQHDLKIFGIFKVG